MEQAYNYTQDITVVRARGLKNKAEDIQEKSGTLKTTATDQSTTELSTIKSNDIKGQTEKGEQLTDKANQLKGAANILYSAANTLATTQDSNLTALKTDAQKLRDAAKKEPTNNNDLYKAANELATGSIGLEQKATNVIDKFDDVTTKYKTLMAAATGLTLTSDQKQLVKAVDDAYNQLKGIYDGMLNLTKLKNNATALKEAAKSLPALEGPATQLESNVTNLRDGTGSGTDYDRAQTVKSQYEKVVTEFNALPDKTSAQTQFWALKVIDVGNNENAAKVLKAKAGAPTDANKLRKLAEALYEAAAALRGVAGNVDGGAAQALANAVGAGESGGSFREKLKELHEALPGADLTDKAKAVKDHYKIVKEKFEAVVKQNTANEYTSYEALYQEVVQAWTAFDKVYNADLQQLAKDLKNQVGTKEGSNIGDQKMWYHAHQLHGKADTLSRQVSGRPDLTGPLEDLKNAIGTNEEAFGTLQQSLNELKGSAAVQDLKSKSIDVINAYTNVKYAFVEVKNLESKYIDALKADGSNQQLYTNVGDEFNNLKTKYDGAISGKDPYFWKKWIIKYQSIVCQWLNFLTYVLLWIVYDSGTGTDPGPKGCEGQATASTETPQTINSVKLALTPASSEITHTITINPGGTDGELTYKSDPITLGSGNGTLTINLPGGEIKLKDLTINSNTLTINNTGSKVSVTKGDEKINLQSANLTSSGNQLTITKQDTNGQDEATITSSDGTSVALDYKNGTGSITIDGNAISDLRKYEPKYSPQYYDTSVYAFKKWTDYDAGKFYLFLSILIVIKITLAAIFICSLHYRDSSISLAIVNQPKMSTFLSILFYMCHESQWDQVTLFMVAVRLSLLYLYFPLVTEQLYQYLYGSL
ncbi:Tpr-related protein family member, putative [Theileria annulata]|uniref:Tpr-related protein family member, putative n=1 Tax=Theileria annulata TaxID=5874 RepID=Q4UFV5_THEAN|nr:Tpr-related protein family member, putative [Theileria annulata]CAI74203.1 Tpr-related protein family member, putative [Theileria annulata]|eukprot:XP_951935.1 Tpr-related protein family member, putative [Theileria annulata]